MAFSERLDDAFIFAHGLHRHQIRKGSRVPYVTHLLAVASLVGEYEGSEDQVIAALLHDAIEDQGGSTIGDVIRSRFGEKVAQIVKDCSDTDKTPKPPWRERKVAYLKHLHQVSPDTLLVSAADKLHNARSILADLRANGPDVWQRFRGGRQGTLWYYRSLVDTYRDIWPSPLTDELGLVVDEIERLDRTSAE